jgi:hypothetical protein
MTENTDMLFLPAVVSSFYGTSQGDVEDAILRGSVKIGEREYHPRSHDDMWFDKAELIDTTIVISGGVRSFGFTYTQRDEDARTGFTRG